MNEAVKPAKFRLEFRVSNREWDMEAEDYFATEAEAFKELDKDAARWSSHGFQFRVMQGDKLVERPTAAPANPKQAFGDKKVPLHLVPPALEVSVGKGLGEGAVKYGPWNWRTTKVEAMTYVGAIKRHLAAWVDGEETDPESTTGKHHLDGVSASLAILLDALHGGFLIDNRPPSGPGPRLVLTPKEG